MNLLLQETGNEVNIAREPIESGDDQRATPGARLLQCAREKQRILARSGLDVLIPLVDGKTFFRSEGFNVRSLSRQSQSASALFLRAARRYPIACDMSVAQICGSVSVWG